MQGDAGDARWIKGACNTVKDEPDRGTAVDQRACRGAMDFASLNDSFSELGRHQPKKRMALDGMRQTRPLARDLGRAFDQDDGGHGVCMTGANLFATNMS